MASLALVTACGPGAARPPGQGPGQTGTVRPAPSASPGLDGCFTAAQGAIETMPAAGRGKLAFGIAGTGPDVIVLSNESDEDLCSWLPLATRLTAARYRVVLWDYAAGPALRELTGLVKHLCSAGTRRVVLMGASEGAKASLIAAAKIRPQVQGVVSLSAEAVLNPGIAVIGYVRRLRCPLLLVTAAQDAYGSALAARQFLAAAPGKAKRLVTVPGSRHGTDLLTGQAAARTLPPILAFLHQVLGN